MSTCYRHPSRETGVSCSSCGRPICPDCMTPTSVGMRCPECARQKTQVRSPSGPSFNRFSTGYGRWSATQVLIAINVLVFVAELVSGVSLGGGDDHGWVFNNGALFGPYLTPHLGLEHDQYWRLLTSGFLHESLIHIALNMFSLFLVGRVLEPGIGRINFLAIYLAALFAGSFGALAFTPDAATVGASGAIFGVFGALAVVASNRGISLWSTGIVPMLLINLVFDLTDSSVAIGGHIGGFIAGLICGMAVVELAERRGRRSWALAVCLLVAGVSIVAAIAVAGGHGIAPNGVTL